MKHKNFLLFFLLINKPSLTLTYSLDLKLILADDG
jgi:hypothetical protein